MIDNPSALASFIAHSASSRTASTPSGESQSGNEANHPNLSLCSPTMSRNFSFVRRTNALPPTFGPGEVYDNIPFSMFREFMKESAISGDHGGTMRPAASEPADLTASMKSGVMMWRWVSMMDMVVVVINKLEVVFYAASCMMIWKVEALRFGGVYNQIRRMIYQRELRSRG